MPILFSFPGGAPARGRVPELVEIRVEKDTALSYLEA
jgi:hypothetical protein